MTQDEKLDLVLSKIVSMDERIGNIEGKLGGMDERIGNIEDKIECIDENINDLDRGVRELKRAQMKYTAEIKAGDELILDEVERVHELLNKHIEDRIAHTA